MTLTSLDKEIIKALQQDLPQTLNPYETLAQQLHLSEEALLEKVRLFQEKGLLRRLGAVVRHHQVGYTHNVMVVWQVPEHLITATGHHMAARPEISHCYQRPTRPNWPFNLFTMIHGTSEAACLDFVQELAAETGIQHYQLLTSLRELKKTSMRYFCESPAATE
ncbi:Lrp/AsnC family transcriptional regulator [Anoxynatronum buryatiense]|uniref:siroheme decarboxylase n=1 Tax=Anoxynatronum buryatiense TaxID=489973 RepID=A0AA45WVK4_9CLOT|nr:Lrp/AsnC family transcriptional regulator [Anoxynatronum buryatiense]SMP54299.1 transcriptional regulator, AsnC family [Anoxynatronum buryatiense]